MTSRNTFRLVIASVNETLFDDDAASVTIPGSDGDATLLAHHEPFVTTLRKGKITARPATGASQSFDVESGVVECSGNSVTVLL